MARLSAKSQPGRDGPNRAERRRRYVSPQVAADYLGVTDRTIRQMIADGRLTGYRSGKRLVRLDLNEIDAAMQPFGGAA
ncbi:excisionase family DNA-binding protein [Mycolicibacterium fortuitum]|nr:excisionase family DNA-binding protein [Mycolicibacterium fortuitum]